MPVLPLLAVSRNQRTGSRDMNHVAIAYTFCVPMRSLLPTFLLLSLTLDASSLLCQELPSSATPRGVVFAFLNETASDRDSINRKKFTERFTGEMGRVDPESFRGLVGSEWKFRIDSIPNLVNVNEEDSLLRTVAYVTLTGRNGKENWYIFCAGDSIWRIESLVRFPLQRPLILASISKADSSPAYLARRAELMRVLLPDDSLCNLLCSNIKELEKLVAPLSKGERWKSFTVSDIDFNSLEEYRELDDDIVENDLIFYSMNRGAIEGLKKHLGLNRVERDRRYADAIFFVIGDFDNESVGYVFTPEGGTLPTVSRKEFFVMKLASKGWWMYKRKTTAKVTESQ